MQERGFTLIEMAIVMLIIGVLIGTAILPLRAQRDSANINQARKEIKTMVEAMYGFAIANNRLPCPTLPNAGGAEQGGGAGNCIDGGGNDFSHGFVPSSTLGLKGSVNCDGLLVDPWGNPYRYSITMADLGGVGAAGADFDFAITNQIKLEKDLAANGLADVVGDLRICSNLGAPCNNGTAAANQVADEVIAIIFSMGKHWTNLSADEQENAGEANTSVASTCGLPDYPLGNDRFFYASNSVEVAGSEFDDIVEWLSTSVLYAKLLAVGHLP